MVGLDGMAKDKKFKNVELDLNNIPGWVESFCSENNYELKDLKEKKNSQVVQYEIILNDCSFRIDFYFSKGNRYSIYYGTGSRQDISEEFANYIMARIGTVNTTDINQGFKVSVKEDTFLAFIELLCDEDVEYSKTEQNNEYLYRLKSQRYGDNITVHYYKTTKNLFIQGNRFQLFNKAVDLISAECPTTDVVAAELRYAKIDIPVDTMMNEVELALGEAYNFLAKAHKELITTSFILYRIEVPMPDYSTIVQPIARGMEGYMLKLLADNDIDVEEKSVGYFFSDEEAAQPLTMHAQYVAKIDNDDIVYEINKLYKWWFRNRHQFSHARENDYLTVIIKDRKVADSLFKEAVELINSSYKNIVAAKK